MSSKVSIQESLFYSQLTFAMNAARVIKVIGLSGSTKRTHRLLITFAMEALVINSAKLWDTSGTALNLQKFLDRKDIPDEERKSLNQQYRALAKQYTHIILRLRKWRHELVGHLSMKLKTVEEFNSFDGDDIAEIQAMLSDVGELLENTSWYPKEAGKMGFVDYEVIENDLGVSVDWSKLASENGGQNAEHRT